MFSIESYYSLAIYFLVMMAIGVFAYHKSTSNISDYVLGGRNVSPQVTALSAGASDMSGWMLMGLPGAMFILGVEAVWIAIGLLIGAWLNYTLVAPRLRAYSELAQNSLTLPEFFSERFHLSNSVVRIISATIIVIFFTVYTSSGLVAGGKLFESALGVDYYLGLVITISVVVMYTLLGGFLAVSLTDFVQGCIMFLALVLVPYVTFTEFDSLAHLTNTSVQQTQTIKQWWEASTPLLILSSLAWGLGYFGQPHIVVRFMAIRSTQDVPIARNIGMTWMTVCIIGSLATGFTGAAYVNHTGNTLQDPETVFIYLSHVLFHPLISGFLLAAILAAIMSTISSQLLVASSSLTEDIYRTFIRSKDNTETIPPQHLVKLGRAGVVIVAIVAGILATNRNSSILDLVSHAWAGFGAAFGPVMLACLFWPRTTKHGVIWGMISGATTVVLWSYLPLLDNGSPLSSLVYEIIPGFFISSVTLITVSLLDKYPNKATYSTFKQVTDSLSSNKRENHTSTNANNTQGVPHE